MKLNERAGRKMGRFKNTIQLLIPLITLLFTSLPEVGLALGFGQIKLYSYLNEPLDAEIELLGTDEVDLSHVIASLASAQDFQRIQLARPYFLTRLRFEVVQQGSRAAIHVTSEDPVKQPFLEFLVVLTWAEGRLVRGYTLLLDPAPFGNAAKRDTKEAKQSKEPASLSKQDQQALLKIQDKLSSNNINFLKSNAKIFAKNEGQATQDVIASNKTKSNPAVENLEALFDTESNPKEEQPLPIDKAPAIAIDTLPANTSAAEAEVVPVSENEAIFLPDNPNQNEPASTSFLTRITQSNFIAGFYENRLLLGSGFALLFSVALTVWVLKRARETLPVTTAAHKTTPTYEKPVEIFDDEMNIKLELARQYLTIQDLQSARDILEEVVARGNQREKDAAALLLKKISS